MGSIRNGRSREDSTSRERPITPAGLMAWRRPRSVRCNVNLVLETRAARRPWRSGRAQAAEPQVPPPRNGYDFAARFPNIATTVESLPVRSCVLDGEAVVVDEKGLSVFDALRYRLRDHDAVLCAFDLLELDGADFRLCRSSGARKRLSNCSGVPDGIAFNRHFTGDGASRSLAGIGQRTLAPKESTALRLDVFSILRN